MEWLGVTAVVSIFFIIAICANFTVKLLTNIDKSLESVRLDLRQIEKRTEKMADKLHGIESHTKRAVRDQYVADFDELLSGE